MYALTTIGDVSGEIQGDAGIPTTVDQAAAIFADCPRKADAIAFVTASKFQSFVKGAALGFVAGAVAALVVSRVLR